MPKAEKTHKVQENYLKCWLRLFTSVLELFLKWWMAAEQSASESRVAEPELFAVAEPEP